MLLYDFCFCPSFPNYKCKWFTPWKAFLHTVLFSGAFSFHGYRLYRDSFSYTFVYVCQSQRIYTLKSFHTNLANSSYFITSVLGWIFLLLLFCCELLACTLCSFLKILGPSFSYWFIEALFIVKYQFFWQIYYEEISAPNSRPTKFGISLLFCFLEFRLLICSHFFYIDI